MVKGTEDEWTADGKRVVGKRSLGSQQEVKKARCLK